MVITSFAIYFLLGIGALNLSMQLKNLMTALIAVITVAIAANMSLNALILFM